MAENGTTRISKAFTQLATGAFEKPVVGRALFEAIAQEFSRLQEGWEDPTGTASTVTFDADESTTVSNPPTQAEVQAINDRLLETRQVLKAVIDTLLGAP